MKTVLVIDDEIGYRTMIQYELGAKGEIVLTAGGGPEALEVLDQNKVDLVITDMKMSPMDGLDTVIEIKKRHPDVPIVIMTGYAINERVEAAMKLTSNLCLRKPFNIEDLWGVVASR